MNQISSDSFILTRRIRDFKEREKRMAISIVAMKIHGEKKKDLKELQYVEPDFSGISTEDLL